MIKHTLTQYWQQSSIKKKLSATFTLMNMVAVLLMLLMLSIGQYFSLNHNLKTNIAVQSQMLSEMIAPALLFNDKSNATELLSGFKHSKFVLRAEVILHDGEIYAQYVASDGGAPKTPISGLRLRFDQMRFSYPINVNQKHIANLQVLICLDPLYVNLLWFSAMALLIAIVALAISFYLGKYILNSISESITQLSQFVKSLAKLRNYSLRYPHLKTHDEVNDLAQGFNLLLHTIETHQSSLQKELSLRKQAEAEFERLAMFDNVTDLPNRHHFYQYVQDLIETSAANQTTFYLMFIDLDDFKMINDTFGHRAGDLLLQTLGKRIVEVLNGDIGKVFRIGGDEFAVLITKEQALSQVDIIAQHIITQVNQPVAFGDQTGYVGASIGICLYPQQANNYSDLLSRADAAMYQAKSSRKNCFVHFNHGLEQKIFYQQALEAGLRVALLEKELELYYQPIVDLQSLKVQGFEALIRWHHPTFGLISPLEFIPIAEKTGLIVDIGQWVIHTACQQMKAWQEAFNQAFTIAVNVSAIQFCRNEFPQQIRAILQTSALPPASLILELTENSLVDDIENAIIKMEHLNELGVSISLDDFGTGFSSLSYLKRLPIKCLKIDKSFIQPLPDDQDGLAIVNATIAMTNALKIRFIAEGVEHIEQLQMLAGISNGQAQGYFISRPLPAKDIATWLHQLPKNYCIKI